MSLIGSKIDIEMSKLGRWVHIEFDVTSQYGIYPPHRLRCYLSYPPLPLRPQLWPAQVQWIAAAQSPPNPSLRLLQTPPPRTSRNPRLRSARFGSSRRLRLPRSSSSSGGRKGLGGTRRGWWVSWITTRASAASLPRSAGPARMRSLRGTASASTAAAGRRTGSSPRSSTR